MKICFVTRKDPKKNNDHLITTIVDLETEQLLEFTNFNESIAWGIFKEIINIIKKIREDSNYVLMKVNPSSGTKWVLKLYKVPDSYFKNNKEDEDEEEIY